MIYWIWLTQLPLIGPVTARYLIEELIDPKSIYQADAEYLAKMPRLNERQRKSILQNHSLENPKRIFEDCQNNNIFVLCWNDRRYPARAKKPDDAPVVLYYKGYFKNMDRKR